MGSVEGLYCRDDIYFPNTQEEMLLKSFEFLAVEEVNKIGVIA
jgi:hypothetical protein